MRKLFVLLCCLGILTFFSQNTTAQDQELKYIGMPVSGICTGQVYIGGDGQLWYWDIFNVPMLNPGNEGGHRFYVNPQVQNKRFENGFGLKIKQGDLTYYRALNKSGFSDIQFDGEYPVAKVYYKDRQLPVSVTLNAFSPFIPTDAENSGLPVTIMEFTVSNEVQEDIEIEIMGWLQNMSCFHTGKSYDGLHINKTKIGKNYTQLNCKSEDKFRDELPDWGSMCLTLLEKGEASSKANSPKGIPIYMNNESTSQSTAKFGNKLVGCVSGKDILASGDCKKYTFLISWYYPNVHLWSGGHQWKNKENLRHYYSSKFKNAKEVCDYIKDNEWLINTTKIWNKTWYNSTLPKWFLDRTFANVSTLATTASVRFDDLTNLPENEGRYYNFEGVYLGRGTCTHVFHYEQAMGRVFPDLSKKLREQIDLGLSWTNNGIIKYRGEFSDIGHHDGRGYAVDGQAGTIMRIYREHLMSEDNKFLKNNWTRIKKSLEVMIDQDKTKDGSTDGILEGKQYNTLDRIWYGKISWLSGLYAAALKAGEKMAIKVGDVEFANECSRIYNQSYFNISSELFNGEYFIQKLDLEHLDAPNSNIGCHADQLLGQYWSSQVGLGYILPQEKIEKALKSILKYNFVESYGEYLEKAEIPIKRRYAENDESGVIVCTFPNGGVNKAPGKINNDWEKLVVGYFSEIWTGQEHQLAATLLSEGFVEEALNIEKAIHSRYSPTKRNPYNEIEYGNHYTRAMSSYAPFISASGFYYNGPEDIIGFAPKINPGKFKSAFIASKCWGEYSQELTKNGQICKISPKYGVMNIRQVHLNSLSEKEISDVKVTLSNETLESKVTINKEKIIIELDELKISSNRELEIIIK